MALVVIVAITGTTVAFGATNATATVLLTPKPLPVKVRESPGNTRVVNPLETLAATVMDLPMLVVPSETIMLCAPLAAEGMVIVTLKDAGSAWFGGAPPEVVPNRVASETESQ